MRDAAVYAETLAFLMVLSGFVTLAALAPLRRSLLRGSTVTSSGCCPLTSATSN